jgi:protein-disulfide isomerase
MDQYKKDMNSKETAQNLEKISQLAEAIKVHGVPTVLINGKLVQTMSADDLQNAINAAK